MAYRRQMRRTRKSSGTSPRGWSLHSTRRRWSGQLTRRPRRGKAKCRPRELSIGGACAGGALSKCGWSLGWVSAVDSRGQTNWIADAHRDRKRFVVRADEKLTAFIELESAIRR